MRALRRFALASRVHMMLMVSIVLAVVIVWHPSRVLAPPMPYGLLHFPALVSCALCVRNSEELFGKRTCVRQGGRGVVGGGGVFVTINR